MRIYPPADWSKRPGHTHYFDTRSTSTLGHTHHVIAFTYPAQGNGADGHVHDYQGTTVHTGWHFHRFRGITGPAIPLPDGSHYHVVSGSLNDEPFKFMGGYYKTVLTLPRHTHDYSATTGLPLGYEPACW